MAEPTSTKPYLIRAIYEWCVDNALTPYISVVVDAQTRVPMEYVRDGEIVLNLGPLATSHMQMGNERIECTARFSGAARELSIPVSAVVAIYARESGHGMSFDAEPKPAGSGVSRVQPPSEAPPPQPEPPRPRRGRPTLKRVK